MTKKLIMGNEAIALGAVAAGVRVVTGYPGTPSTEVLESAVKHRTADMHVEWSVNEKTAMEVAAGASYAGARTMVTMKQVGLNVASDPLMSLAYVGVKGGMVVLVADDPGPISSQTEQDTRTFAMFAKLPVFDPSSPEEAMAMVADAYRLSEEERTPVILRPTTRICHAYAAMEVPETREEHVPEGFVKSSDWVIFPKLSYAAHKRIEERNRRLRHTLSALPYNRYEKGEGKRGILCGGVSYAYVTEALSILGVRVPICKVGVPFPYPEDTMRAFLSDCDSVLCVEELDPVLERTAFYLCGRERLCPRIHGKEDGTVPCAGELSVDALLPILAAYLDVPVPAEDVWDKAPALPIRPPVLCAGCPHRASFYAVKRAMRKLGKKAVFCGDIGCYTLGNAMPLDMTDTCLCMGAGVTVAQGIRIVEPDTVCFSFAGDSTFFHTCLPNLANAVYNHTPMVAVILDNSTTAMTGHQPNPHTGKTAVGEVAAVIDIEGALRGIGIGTVCTVDPLAQDAAIEAVGKAAEVAIRGEVAAIVFRSPCVALYKPTKRMTILADTCVGCRRCIRELGCPALVKSGEGKKAAIDPGLCCGCGLCIGICPVKAIVTAEEE